MLIPRHWSRATGTADDPSGKRFAFQIWGWSQTDIAEAAALARRRLSEACARVARGGLQDEAYFYGKAPLREEIVRVVTSAEAAVVTRNRYGALVLNTARIPFVDVDLPPGGAGGIRSLFGGKKPSPGDAVLDRLRRACERFSGTTFRVYRTAAGFRLLATDLLLTPDSAETRDLLSAFEADPFFVKLCKLQSSFRARLTPKPWRCGCALPPAGYPFADSTAERSFAAWLQKYEAACRGKATCELVETCGPGRTLPEVEPVVAEHDESCRVAEKLPLA